jgi:hypothetical protein
MGDKVVSILGSIVTVALVTTVLMRGSATAQVITAFGNMFSGALRAAQGR